MNWPTSAFRLTSALTAAAAVLLTASCEKVNDEGVDLPGTTPISTKYRDLPVSASTVIQDSLETLKADRFLVGRLRDANTGITTVAGAVLNLQVAMPVDSLPAKFAGAVLDSAKIILTFDQVTGSSAQPVRFDVYNLAAPLSERETYNSSTTVALGGKIGDNLSASLKRMKKVAQATGIKNKAGTADSTVLVDAADPTVHLVLHKPGQPSQFVRDLFTDLQDGTFNQAKLDARWKGMSIQPHATFSGAIVGFNRSYESRIMVYYHIPAVAPATKPKMRTYALYFGNPSGSDANAPRYFTQIKAERPTTASPFTQLFTGGGAVAEDQSVPASASNGLTYIQEGLGLGTRLVIPGIEELTPAREPGLAVNRAELIIPVQPLTTGVFTNPANAYVYELGNNNRVLRRTVGISNVDRVIQRDGANQQGENAEAIGTLDITGRFYTVVITSYLQAYLYNQIPGTKPTAFMVSPVLRRSTGLSLNRAVLDANNITLRVYYSNLR
ncbi:DUF4270 family protein [Hymenobacter sp. BT175]|uniref:DUF4270 family protein n=1 Tax=Hymenobacter translucens TaxID=2886507 RepID=UPI001D0E7A2C|nr:DUF4270 family protein [Hymenobacter translucens]MCC2545778.1 DUF4270 family protein [Hymenobacter translucens]